MIIDGKNVMTASERKEIIELLVKEGYYRAGLLECTDKQLSKCLRDFRAETVSNQEA